MSQKPIKSLIMDCLPKDQPEGTIRFGKNGIQNYINGAVFNEPGFVRSNAVLPYKVCGIIETDDKPILFTSDGINSAVGYFNPATDRYEPILDDRVLDFKIGFTQRNYIIGEYQRNNKGQIIIAFTDKNAPMMYLNCDEPNVTKYSDLLFFATVNAPTMEVTVSDSGQIQGGSYRVAVKLAKDDGSETQYLGLSSYVFVAADSSTDTANKGLSIRLTDLDTNYDKVIIAILKQNGGTTTAIELEAVTISSEMLLSYSGFENFTVITPEELLIPNKTYTKVGTIGQLNDVLYIGNLTEAEDVLYQRYASMIKVQFNSELYDLDNPNQANKIQSGEVRGLAHEEIYAMYIRLKLTSGGWTRAFHVPGREVTSADRTFSGGTNLSGLRFQLEDTITDFNAATGVGTPGAWENAAETYPTEENPLLDQFDSTSLGGPKLSGLKIRHHKMPSMQFIKASLASRGNASLTNRYGKSVMDVLGVKFSGVVIPAALSDKLTGQYEILFAKRTQNNITNYGQSLVVYNQISKTKNIDYIAQFKNDAAEPVMNTRGRSLITVGGNWTSRAGTFDPDPATILVRESFRLYPFETLNNKPDFPDKKMYMSVNWKTKTTGERAYPNSRPNDGNPTTPTIIVNMDLTETRFANSTVLSPVAFRNVGIGSISYMSNNVNYDAVNGVNNNMGEAAVLATVLKGPMTTEAIEVQNNTINLGDHDKPVTVVTPKEDSFFVTLKALKETLYKNFNTQTLVTTGVLQRVGEDKFVSKGDSFIALHSVITYGAFGYVAGQNLPWTGEPAEGYKVSRTYLVESTANLGNRYEITGNPYSFWFLKQGNFDFAANLEKNKDPNQVGYNKELNAIAEVQSQIFFDNTKIINKFPHRIHRGGKLPREGSFRNWRKFLPLDYYDMPRNLGEITNLEGMDDRLLIHLENALMVTQDKTKLESDVLSVTLGAGDIFQFTPQEAISAKLGLAGSTHDLACYRTPYGYVFPDTAMGQLYVFKEGIKQLNAGLNDFLREFLTVVENNPFIGNGVTIGYDPKYNRILITVKNSSVDVVENYKETAEFYSKLIPGKSIVFKDGVWQTFMGVNTQNL
jgi:hypothetical protein